MINSKFEVCRDSNNGNKWGIYGKQCKCFIVHGTKKQCIEKLKQLKKLEEIEEG